MFVYFHRNPVSFDIFYVGVGIQRRRAYEFKHGRNPYWKNYIAKYGLPVVQIVHSKLSREKAHEWEKHYILMLGRKHSGGQLTNISEGGDCAPELSKEARERSISALVQWVKENPEKNPMKRAECVAKLSGVYNSSKRPEVREKLRLANIGKRATAETRKKQSRLKKGMPSNQPKGYRHAPDVIERMRAINKEITNRPEVKLKMSIAFKGKPNLKNSTGVHQMELSTNRIVCTFPSITAALLSLGKKRKDGNITAVCNGKRKFAYGFKWQYT